MHSKHAQPPCTRLPETTAEHLSSPACTSSGKRVAQKITPSTIAHMPGSPCVRIAEWHPAYSAALRSAPLAHELVLFPLRQLLEAQYAASARGHRAQGHRSRSLLRTRARDTSTRHTLPSPLPPSVVRSRGSPRNARHVAYKPIQPGGIVVRKTRVGLLLSWIAVRAQTYTAWAFVNAPKDGYSISRLQIHHDDLSVLLPEQPKGHFDERAGPRRRQVLRGAHSRR